MPRAPRRYCTIAHPFTHQQLVAAGFTAAELRGWLSRREVIALKRGVFAVAHIADRTDVRAAFLSSAIADGAEPVPVLGAALLHQLPAPPVPHATLARRLGKDAVPSDCLSQLSGLLVPDLAWTALQLARWQTLAGALISLDAALKAGVDKERLRVLADRMRQWPGSGCLAAAIAHADACSESPLESWSRGLMVQADIPTPELQYLVTAGGQRFRLDFAWPDLRVVGEADGIGKYGEGQSARDAIYQEKRRQARLQSVGFTLFRWGWPEVHPAHDAWLHGLRAALSR